MVTKALLEGGFNASAGAALSTTNPFDSTGYTHLIALTKHETDNTVGATMSDNKGSGTWNKLTQQDVVANPGWVQLHWVKIGSPGSGHTVSMATDADANFRFIIVWGINSTTGELELVDENVDTGNSTTPDAGALSNAGADSVVGFWGATDFSGVNYTVPSGFTEDADLFALVAISGAAGSIGPVSSTSISTLGAVSGSAPWAVVSAILKEATSSSTDQEGFAFGDDNGNEASHTLGAQDSSHVGAVGSKTLRLLIDTTDDTPGAAYALRYQKNGTGGYTAVPIGGTVAEAGTYFGGASGGTNPTTTTTLTIPASLPTDCVLCLHFTSRDHLSGTAQPTVSDNNGGATWTQREFTTDRKAQWWWKRFEANLSGKTITISGAVGSLSARLVVIENVFPTGDPFTDFAPETNASGNESHATVTPTNAGSALVLAVYNYANDNAVTGVSAATTGAPGQSTGHLSSGGNDCATHVAVWNNHAASASGTITWAQTNGVTYSHVYAVRPSVTNNEVYIDASANIAGGGEATTARLAAPSGKTTSDFVTGRRWDDENGTDTIDITTDDYTEVEWKITTQSPAANGDYFDFRVYAGASPLTSYGVTPRWTLGTPRLATLVMGPIAPPLRWVR